MRKLNKRTWGAALSRALFSRAGVGTAIFGLILALPLTIQAQPPTPDFPPPPKDTLPLLLRKLQTTARILHITAHPDDEDGGMLTLESRGHGATVMLLTLTRGEGGQNKVGSSLFDELGILRTLELLESDRYYGVEQRFTRVADFGFSKTAQETFEKWHGHDIALADMVRVIREFQPDVITSRFSGTDRDGHGHHQASGILAREAFRAAADPNRFPEQLKQGLLPWQAKKFYMDNVRANEDWNVRFKTSATDPELGGQSYAQVALNGLRHQLSQGAGSWTLGPEDRYSYYKLVDTVLPNYHPAHENDFMDGIDTSLAGLADRMPIEYRAKLRAQLQSGTDQLENLGKCKSEDSDCVVSDLGKLRSAIRTTGLAPKPLTKPTDAAIESVQVSLSDKLQQIEEAINSVTAVTLESSIDSATPLIPSQKFHVDALVKDRGGKAIDASADLELLGRGLLVDSANGAASKMIRQRQTASLRTDDWIVPVDSPITQPYFHREDPERDTVYQLDDPALATLPLTPEPVQTRVVYQIGQEYSSIYDRPILKKQPEHTTPVIIAPEFSLLLDAPSQVVPLSSTTARTIKASVTSNIPGAATAALNLNVPAGWRAEPTTREVKFTHAGEKQNFDFAVTPKAGAEARYEIRAVLTYKGKKYEEGYSLVGRDDIGYAYYFQPSIQRVSMVETKLPQNLKIGYLMGAGDDIPTVLLQLGLDVEPIDQKNLASENLSRFATIILGIRAYDTIDELKKSNQLLLDYVSSGGTLMVQYNADVGDFNSGHFTPYPLEISRDRVSVEEASVEILKPADPIFHFPNAITQADFANWVQERNVNVPSSWDSHFEPLLTCHDPGEPNRDGGLLIAHYGKGLYIYNAYSFFRQLPSGVPGAVRLYVNLLNAGHYTVVNVDHGGLIQPPPKSGPK